MSTVTDTTTRAQLKHKVISTDSHVDVPGDEIAKRVPEEFREKIALIRLSEDDAEDAAVAKMRKRMERMMAKMDEEDLERSRAGGWDPELRIRDQDREGVHGEVIFGPLFFDNSPDPRIDLAISRAFNDWSAEVFNQSVHQRRFAVSAALAVADIPAAIAEVERAAGLGFRCINLPAQQPDRPYNRPDYDPLWAALQDSGMVANFHIGTGHVPQGERGPGGPTINYVLFAQGDGPHIVSYLCASGVLERFPRLQWAVVESGAAWLAWVLESLDQIYQKHHMFHRDIDKLELLPSEYFKRQGHACFMDDAVAVHNRQFTGSQTLMFGTDYPHHEGTFPHTQEVIDRIFAGVPAEETAMIVGGNAAKLYGFDLD
jgi:predicted TIM-barrel fold metal-dependent hydrolase